MTEIESSCPHCGKTREQAEVLVPTSESGVSLLTGVAIVEAALDTSSSQQSDPPESNVQGGGGDFSGGGASGDF